MTDLFEKISPDQLLDLKGQCPFEHDLDEPPTVKNELKGLGSTLGSNMEAGTSTNTYAPFAPKPAQKQYLKQGLLPQNDPAHQCYRSGSDDDGVIAIEFEAGTEHYPLAFSAHHLIPSQGSLKGHKILQYMCAKTGGTAHNHGYSGGQVWSDVGYNTNGSENGVYSPGNYALGRAKKGINAWDPNSTNDGEDYILVKYSSYKKVAFGAGHYLHGSNKMGGLDYTNLCWDYVSQAMTLAKIQFHDKHDVYEDEVENALTRLHEKYQEKDARLVSGGCPKCKQREQQLKKMITQKGFPAPYKIVNDLKKLSNNLRTCLELPITGWRRNIYTSEWCNVYMDHAIKHGLKKTKAGKFHLK